MNTDSYIQALRRFRKYSDNGSNFVGAQRERAKAFQEIDHQKINTF